MDLLAEDCAKDFRMLLVSLASGWQSVHMPCEAASLVLAGTGDCRPIPPWTAVAVTMHGSGALSRPC